MENYSNMPMNPMSENMMRPENMTRPENTMRQENISSDCYIRVYPHVQDIVNTISDEDMYYLTEDDITYLTDEVARRSNITNDPPAGHNPFSARDFARALIIGSLFDRHRRHRRRRFNPFFPFFFPF